MLGVSSMLGLWQPHCAAADGVCVCAAKMFGSIACEGEVHALWATTEWEANSCRNFCAHVMP